MTETQRFLLDWTKMDEVAWMKFIQDEIAKATPNTGELHPTTDSATWLKAVVDKACATYPNDKQYDENIMLASVVALALLTWSMRVRRAKAYDPRRPVANRQRAMQRLLFLQQEVLRAMVDESHDHEVFPGQEWDPPFAPNAKDGSFV